MKSLGDAVCPTPEDSLLDHKLFLMFVSDVLPLSFFLSFIKYSLKMLQHNLHRCSSVKATTDVTAYFTGSLLSHPSVSFSLLFSSTFLLLTFT